jgi:hypothetical protein
MVRAMQLKLISLLGLVVFIALAWAISSNRKLFPIHLRRPDSENALGRDSV